MPGLLRSRWISPCRLRPRPSFFRMKRNSTLWLLPEREPCAWATRSFSSWSFAAGCDSSIPPARRATPPGTTCSNRIWPGARPWACGGATSCGSATSPASEIAAGEPRPGKSKVDLSSGSNSEAGTNRSFGVRRPTTGEPGGFGCPTPSSPSILFVRFPGGPAARPGSLYSSRWIARYRCASRHEGYRRGVARSKFRRGRRSRAHHSCRRERMERGR